MTEFKNTDHTDREARIDAYLWDPSADPVAEVQEVERRLVSLRPSRVDAPRVWQSHERARAPRPRRNWLIGLAAAASLLAALGWITTQWRWSWPAGRAWTIAAATASLPNQLNVGAALTLSGSDRADVKIARIGTLQVEGDARLTLQSTQGVRHRLTLDRGTVRVRVWAPPGSVVFRTPAGEVIDLGCEFDLTAEPSRSIVHVRSGWVQLENGVAETLVPAGATSEMTTGRAPTVPVYADANPRFIEAVLALQNADTADRAAALATVRSLARERDVLTLLMLVARNLPGSSELATRAAELFPPPSGVTVNGIIRGDRDGLWRWRETLPLPPPKGWIRNWRDALPLWLSGR
jgi:hypothetical protein